MQLINRSIFLALSIGMSGFYGGVALAGEASSVSSGSTIQGGQTLAHDYRLGANDRIAISVYGEDDLSREYVVSPGGTISLALIGDVVAKGRTPDELKSEIVRRLGNGFINNPTITLVVTGFRNFYILGEVNKPGEFQYESGLTLTQAVAAASGFTYRAAKRYVFIRHEGEAKEVRVPLAPDMQVLPGDTIRLGERYF